MEQLATAALLANMICSRLERADAFFVAGQMGLVETNVVGALKHFDDLAAAIDKIRASLENGQ